MTDVIEKTENMDSARNVVAWRYDEAALISEIRPSGFNPRKVFDEAYIAELAATIAQHGVLQPIALRAISGDANGLYEIVCGECRYRAAKLAGLAVIPARIASNMSDQQALQIAIIENLQRKDINAIEEANGFLALRDMGYQVQEIADKVGCGQSTISNSMRLLELPGNVQDAVSAGLLTKSHARALVPFASSPAVVAALLKGVSEGLTSKVIEAFKVNEMPSGARSELNKLITDLDQTWSRKFSPEENCKGCATRMKRFCLDKECFAEKNAEAAAAALAKANAEMANGNLINLSLLDSSAYRHQDNDNLDCDPECEHIRQFKTGGGSLRPICLDPECYDQKLKAAQDKKAAEKQARIDAIIARSMDVIHNDPEAEHRLRVLAVYKCIASQNEPFVRHLEEAAAKFVFDIDFSAIRECIDNTYQDAGKIALLDALYELPEIFLCEIVAEATLRSEAHSWQDKIFNNWFCGGEPDAPGAGDVESRMAQNGADCAEGASLAEVFGDTDSTPGRWDPAAVETRMAQNGTDCADGDEAGVAVESGELRAESSEGNAVADVCPHDGQYCGYYQSCVGARCHRWDPDVETRMARMGTDGADGDEAGVAVEMLEWHDHADIYFVSVAPDGEGFTVYCQADGEGDPEACNIVDDKTEPHIYLMHKDAQISLNTFGDGAGFFSYPSTWIAQNRTEHTVPGDTDICQADCLQCGMVGCSERRNEGAIETVTTEEKIVDYAADGGPAGDASCDQADEPVAGGGAAAGAYAGIEPACVDTDGTAGDPGDPEPAGSVLEAAGDSGKVEISTAKSKRLEKAVGHIINTSVEDALSSVSSCSDLAVLAAARAREVGSSNRRTLIKALDVRMRKLERNAEARKVGS